MVPNNLSLLVWVGSPWVSSSSLYDRCCLELVEVKGGRLQPSFVIQAFHNVNVVCLALLYCHAGICTNPNPIWAFPLPYQPTSVKGYTSKTLQNNTVDERYPA